MQLKIDRNVLEAIVPKQIKKDDDLPSVLFELRKLAGMNQLDVAEIIGLTRTSVTNMEAGKQPVTLDAIDKLAGYLGLEVHVTINAKPTPNVELTGHGLDGNHEANPAGPRSG